MIASTPATRKLGTIVMAGSPFNTVSSGHASITSSSGAMLPWSISPGPWDAPPSPAKMPIAEAATLVLLGILIDFLLKIALLYEMFDQ